VRERLLLYLCLTAALAFVLVLRLDVIGAVAAASHPPGGEALREAPRVWTALSTWPEYARLLFVPASLAADYAPGVVPVVFHWTGAAVLGLAMGLGALLGAWATWRRGRPLSAGVGSERVLGFSVLWIVGALLPVANMLYLAPILVAERTLYLASLGAAAIGGWLFVSPVERHGDRAALLLLVVLAAGAARTVTRVPAWDDSDSVMAALIEDRPESGTAWMHLGRRLAAQGRPQDALTAFGYAVVLLNSEYRPSTEIASHLLSMGRPDRAVFFLERAWREHPEWQTAPGLLAAAQLNAGRPEKAAPAARAAVFLQPSNESMHHLLAQAYAGMGAWEDAVVARRASLRGAFNERARSWILLGVEEANLGDTASALAALDSAGLRDMTPEERAARDSIRASLSVPSGGAR